MNLEPFLSAPIYQPVLAGKAVDHPPELEVLAGILEQTGTGGFGEGLLWIEHPEAMTETFGAWVNPRPGVSMVPFARTAFGNIFYLAMARRGKPSPGILDVHHKTMRPAYAHDTEDFFNGVLLSEDYQRDELQRDLFEKAKSDHGPLSAGECYYPTPALALGGNPNGPFGKGRWDVHLDLLRQM